MAIFDRFFKRQKPTQTKSANMVGYFGVGTGNSKNYQYDELAREGYLKNAIVYRCVNEISKGAGAVQYMIKSNDETLDSHPIMDLLDRPNPQQSYAEFFTSLYGYLMLSGNNYMLKVGGDQMPRELHLLRPDRIVIAGSNTSIPERYDYMINGRVEQEYAVDQENGFSEVKHTKLWSPLDDYYGLSPLSAAAVEVDQHNLASRHNINLLNNGARPSGAVIFKPKDEQGYTVNLTEAQRQQVLTDLNNRFTSPQNAGRPLLLEGDFDWREMGLSPRDMDFINLKHMSATDIALCFGVPSQLVGVPDSQTYNNVAEARLALYEETIIPHLRLVESDLNEWLAPMYEDIEFKYDIDSIPALAERKKKTYENVVSAVNAGIMTRNEAREVIGLSPVNGGDDIYISANLFPLGSEATEEPDAPLEDESLGMYEDSLDEEKQTNFPNRGDDQKISLRNSKYPQFDYDFAKNVKEVGVGKEIWKAGGNIRGNEAFMLWGRARQGSETPAVLDWIKERESWAARHMADGNQFADGDLSPNLSNVAGIVAQMKWGVINEKLGEQGMKDVILELTKKLEGRKHGIYNFSKKQLEVIEKQPKVLSDRINTALQNKVDDHNDKHGDDPTKRATLRMLQAVFRRGIGAYQNNPASVRPRVANQDQWAYARVNSYLFALRSGRFQGGQHDTDLFPKGHPLSSK